MTFLFLYCIYLIIYKKLKEKNKINAIEFNNISDNLSRLCYGLFPEYCKYCPVFIANGNKKPNSIKRIDGCDYQGRPADMINFMDNCS